ncbi:hypothetical protein H4R18_004205 [Coemansia javaensis]|uniref:Myb-like domain-containing protein n=1 Tax=Coemansia javaensis TaxID=2761396 RepID=A0A9W8HA49_9FUNG|nr:hypothetical protein H4R18_004205 [Coemansia javaensis]
MRDRAHSARRPQQASSLASTPRRAAAAAGAIGRGARRHSYAQPAAGAVGRDGSDSESYHDTETDSNDTDNEAVSPTHAGAEVLPSLTAQDAPGSDLFSQIATQEPAAEQDGAAGPPSAGDLVVLDHVSQRILDEVAALGRLLDEPLDSAGSVEDLSRAMQRLDCLAREQTLIRRFHFTREPFVGEDLNPLDAADRMQWPAAHQRINLAAFATLVFRPQVTMGDAVGPAGARGPARRLNSLGFEAACGGFFAHVVPAGKRDASAISLLVDMQTQKWLMAATGDDHLHAMVAEERGMDDAGICSLLAIEPGSDGPFDRDGVGMYRAEMGQRLDAVSRAPLAAAQAQHPMLGVWKRVAQFTSYYAGALSHLPMLDDLLQRRAAAAAAAAADAGGSDAESAAPETAEARPQPDSQISGDLEVTIFKPAARPSPEPPRPEPPRPEPAEPEPPRPQPTRALAPLARDIADVATGQWEDPPEAAPATKAGDSSPGSPSRFRGRRGIATENLSQLGNNRIQFTPTPAATPEPDEAAAPGEYRPLQLGTDHQADRRAQPDARPRAQPDADRRGDRRADAPQRDSGGKRQPLRTNNPWTDAEVECLINAVYRHGMRWAVILQHHGPNGIDDTILQHRTRYNLKDKARTIKLALLRQNKSPGRFAQATGSLK